MNVNISDPVLHNRLCDRCVQAINYYELEKRRESERRGNAQLTIFCIIGLAVGVLTALLGFKL